jgi:hypothetical protein
MEFKSMSPREEYAINVVAARIPGDVHHYYNEEGINFGVEVILSWKE